MARARTGQLIKRASGFYARIWTMVDGEHVRVMRALGTHSKAAAKAKLARMLAADSLDEIDPKRAETFREAAARVYAARIAAGAPKEELKSLERVAFDVIGDLSVTDIEATNINEALDAAKAAGLSRQSAQHLRQRMSNVFKALVREGALKANPVSAASMPDYPATVTRERAVLTNAELAVYLAWTHPKRHRRDAVRERQTMVCVSRMFGGLRTGDLHALRWEAFDVERGGFEWGWAPRSKTKRPQLLAVPEMLRPTLRAWWERAGKPSTGLLFPVRRAGRRGDRIGEQRLQVSHASAFRRDLQAAFTAAVEHDIAAPTKDSKRWAELFTETEYTRPVDFHSWRRAYVQALADADINAQQAAALAGHADLAAHARYLRNAGKLRELPAAALPDLSSMPAIPIDTEADAAQWALAKGRTSRTDADSPGQRGGVVTQFPEETGVSHTAVALRKPLLYPAELRERSKSECRRRRPGITGPAARRLIPRTGVGSIGALCVRTASSGSHGSRAGLAHARFAASGQPQAVLREQVVAALRCPRYAG